MTSEWVEQVAMAQVRYVRRVKRGETDANVEQFAKDVVDGLVAGEVTAVVSVGVREIEREAGDEERES